MKNFFDEPDEEDTLKQAEELEGIISPWMEEYGPLAAMIACCNHFGYAMYDIMHEEQIYPEEVVDSVLNEVKTVLDNQSMVLGSRNKTNNINKMFGGEEEFLKAVKDIVNQAKEKEPEKKQKKLSWISKINNWAIKTLQNAEKGKKK